MSSFLRGVRKGLAQGNIVGSLGLLLLGWIIGVPALTLWGAIILVVSCVLLVLIWIRG